MIRVVGAGCVSGLETSRVAVDGVPADHGRAARMAERLMSRSAMLAHLATRAAIAGAGWEGDLGDVGFFMGVGASGGSVEQLEAMLAASIDEGGFSIERFGRDGLRACNPLYAFQLMNNFAMCHAAILAGTRGPNAALFSRGGGTVAALIEAAVALDEGCDRALAGGADTAIDPVTEAELCRRGWIAEGMRPAEGAAILALSTREEDEAIAVISRCERRADRRALELEVDAVITAAWGPARQRELAACAGGAEVIDLGADALAATPAIGWTVALDLIANGRGPVAVLSAGIDGEIGVVVLDAPVPPPQPSPRGGEGVRPRRLQGDPEANPPPDGGRIKVGGAAFSEREPVITGAGVVSAFGLGIAALLDGLAAGASAVGPIRAFDAASFPTRLAAEVPEDIVPRLGRVGDLPEELLRDRKLLFAVGAAAEAWGTASCSNEDAAAASLSLAVGLEQAFLEDFEQSFNNGRVDWDIERYSRTPSIRTRSPIDLTTAAVRSLLGLGGLAVTHVSACAAGTLAIAHAASLIRRGEAEIVVCGGADSMINPLGLGGMSRLGAPSPEACRPFDRRRDGLVMGEGAAVFVLESRARAEARGARPLAAVLGWGSSQDGYKATAPRPDGSAAAAAMTAALDRAGLAPADIGYINAHGTGTPAGDPAEVAAIRRAFGDAAAAIPISSIKGAVGHLMAAAGAIEVAACLLAFDRDTLPGTAGHQERAADCELDIIGPAPRAARVDAVLSNSAGFGGQNASIVLGRMP